MDLGLEGKTVIVTGGASNVGRGIVLAFAREKANVVIADLDEKQAQRTAADAEAEGGRATSVSADVCDSTAVEAMVNASLDAFGGIDVLVNNVTWAVQGPLLVDKQDDEIEREIRTAYLSAVLCTRAVARHLIDQGHGRIINLGSNSGRSGQARAAIYSANKAAIIGLTRALAKELGRYNITVNCVCPGVVLPEKPEDTGEGSFWYSRSEKVYTLDYVEKLMKGNPIRRVGRAEEVADMVTFLASDCASYITGQTIAVDGGGFMS
ncbi:MAG: SDR family oxidoreductase [Dehalococcoidia bacterium]|nr:SDR family oxidoreductase [Dehalococcoidia bacterium]